MRNKRVKFNRKPALDRAKTYKLKTPKKSDYIEKIQGIIDNIGLTTAADMQLSVSPVHQYINTRHFTLIERFDKTTVTVITYVNEEMVDEQDISYEEVSLENLEIISNHLADYAIQKELQ
jgi:hypothetical protein